MNIEDIANLVEDGYLNGNKQTIRGKLELNVEKEVVVYWYWPYEYENLSSSIKQSIKLSTVGSLKTIVDDETSPKYKKLVKYFDIDKLKEIANDSISWNETQLYDYADTRIGTYVKSIKLHLEVKGYHAAEEPTQSEE